MALRLTVFGASGKCGALFVRLAAAAGHSVTAVVRPKTAYEASASVRVLRGEVMDSAFVQSCLQGCEAVMSGLGMKRRDPPPERFTSKATANIVQGMMNEDVPRISIISAGGVGDSRPHTSWFIRLATSVGPLARAYADLERAEAVLRASPLSWQSVRPVTLTDRPATGAVRVLPGYPVTATIPREDVAAFMLRELERAAFSVQTPIIAASRGR